MEARLSKTEIEKIVKMHLQHTTIKKWDGQDLIVDIDIRKLNKEEIHGEKIFTFPSTMKQSSYVICPILKENDTKNYLIIQ